MSASAVPTRPYAVSLTAERTCALVDEQTAPLGPTDVLVQTRYSGISAGTELSFWRGTSPFFQRQYDTERRIFLPVEGDAAPQWSYPVIGTGYEEVGEVLEVGAEVEEVSVGDLVYGTWGHRSHTVLTADYLAPRVLPEGVDPLVGVFSHIGAIAFNGIIDAAPRLGETVVVFGMGVVGQLIAQLARLAGAHVLVVDPVASRRETALACGAAEALDPLDVDVAAVVRERTAGRGADICIEASGHVAALHEAVRTVAYASTVVTLGFYQGGSDALRLGEEFHHNRTAIVCSQIGGVAPHLQHRWDRLRLVSTFMDLACSDKVDVRPLVTHVSAPTEAADLYRMLEERPADAIQAVLDFAAEVQR